MLPFPIVYGTLMPIVRPFHKVDLRFPIQFGLGVGRECTDPGLVSFGLPLRPLVCGTGILWGSRMSSVAHNLIPNTPNVARRLSTDHHRSTRWGGCRKRRSVMCKSALQNGCVCEVQKPRQSPPLLLPPSFAISCYHVCSSTKVQTAKRLRPPPIPLCPLTMHLLYLILTHWAVASLATTADAEKRQLGVLKTCKLPSLPYCCGVIEDESSGRTLYSNSCACFQTERSETETDVGSQAGRTPPVSWACQSVLATKCRIAVRSASMDPPLYVCTLLYL
jgi:hypothetical protein